MLRKETLAVISAVLLSAGLLAGVAFAQSTSSVVTQYTGCLNAANGTLYNLAPGTTPLARCRGKDPTVSLGTGTVSDIVAGQGLSGGGSGPSVGLSLSSSPLPPQAVDVNCSSGQTISEAVTNSSTLQPLTITISGICQESVTVSRDDVTLEGVTPGSGIQAPPNRAAISLIDAHRIVLSQLTLMGGGVGLNAVLGSTFQGQDLQISGQSGAGVSLSLNAAGVLSNSNVENTNTGVNVGAGGSIVLSGDNIENSTQNGIVANQGDINMNGGVIRDTHGNGVQTNTGGNVALRGVTIQDSAGAGIFEGQGGTVDVSASTIEGNGQTNSCPCGGVDAFQGGSIFIHDGTVISHNGQFGGVFDDSSDITISGATVSNNTGGGVTVTDSGIVVIQNGALIENNTGDGVSLSGGSTGIVQGSTISGNGVSTPKGPSGNGISVHDTSVLQSYLPSSQIVGNYAWGVFCSGSPSVAGIVGGNLQATVSGNGAGQISCPFLP